MEYDIEIDRPWPGVPSPEALDEIFVAMTKVDGACDPVGHGGENTVGVSMGVQADSYDEAFARVATAFDAAIASALARSAA